MPVEVDIASEFRYRAPDMPKGGARALHLAIRRDRRHAGGAALCQDAGPAASSRWSTSPRARWRARPTRCCATLAGPEIGVASTKAFTTQLVVLACFAIALARARGKIDAAREAQLSTALTEVPSRATEVLAMTSAHRRRSRTIIAEARDVLYLGRGTAYPAGARGRAEAQGDLLHPRRGLCRRRDEARADRADRRDGAGDRAGAARRALRQDRVERAGGGGTRRQGGDDLRPRRARRASDGQSLLGIEVPTCDPFVAPLLYAIPVQLLAYHVAVAKGTDVDQPRNLAKSVTVE